MYSMCQPAITFPVTFADIILNAKSKNVQGGTGEI